MNIFNPYGTLSELKDYNYLLLYLIVYFSCQINIYLGIINELRKKIYETHV